MANSGNKSGGVGAHLRGLVRGLWSQEGTLGQKAVRSGVWVMGSMAVTRVLGMVQTIILVRLLVPEDFGIMRIAGFLLAAMATFTATGMSTAIIQRKDIDDATLNTAWTIQILRNMILFLAVFLVAPWGARFYENPLICPILRLVSLRFLLGGFDNIGVALLRKELDFRRHELFEVTINVIAIVLTVTVALFLRSVWALAIGWVAFAFLRLVGSYIVHPYRPRIAFHWEKAAPLISFGKHMLAAGIVIFLKTQLDDAILGKMLGMEALGFYTLAYALSNLPATWITRTISGVTFPAYSKLQNDQERLGKAFLKVLRISSAISIPAAAGLFILAPEIVNVVYGARYAPMIPAFRILCLFGLFRSIGATMGPVFAAVGKPYIVTYLVTGDLVLMLGLIYPLTNAFGIPGTAWATVVPQLLDVAIAMVVVRLIVTLPRVSIASALCKPLLTSLIMVLAVMCLRGFITDVGAVWLVGMAAFGATTYLLTTFLLSRKLVRETAAVAKSIVAGYPAIPGKTHE